MNTTADEETSDVLLPPADYYMHDEFTDTLWDQRDAETHFQEGGKRSMEINLESSTAVTPIGRNMVEFFNTVHTERNTQTYAANTKFPTISNYYDDFDVDVNSLKKIPHTYILLGKPGIGKTTLAKKMAEILNAIYVNR